MKHRIDCSTMAVAAIQPGVLFRLIPALVVSFSTGFTAQAQNFPSCPNWTHILTFVNQGDTPIQVKETPGCFPGNIQQPPFNGSNCWPSSTKGEFQVPPGLSNAVKVTVPSCWSGNFGVKCDTCKSGVQTLAEFTFDGGLDVNAQKLPGLIDTYDVSLVDGFTKALNIVPDMNVAPGGGTCARAGCQTAPTCPVMLTDGDACQSPNQYVLSHAGQFTDTDRKKYGCVCGLSNAQACTDVLPNHDVPSGCGGEFGCSPFSQPGQTHADSACCPFFGDPTQQCSATSKDRAWDQWAQAYITTVHQSCPGEYAWQFDDQHGTFTCQGSTQTPMNYTLTASPKLITSAEGIQISRVASSAGLLTGVPAPGSLATLFLSGLSGVEGVQNANPGKLPFELAGVRVSVAGVPAPILSVASLDNSQKVEFQVPWESKSSLPVVVEQGTSQSTLSKSSTTGWGVLFTDSDNYVLAQHSIDYSDVTPANPARAGEWITAYATNLGPVASTPGTGEPAQSEPLSPIITQSASYPTLGVAPFLRLSTGEKQAEFNYAGLTPGTVGIYQINLRIPEDTTPGDVALFVQKTETCPLELEQSCGFRNLRITRSAEGKVAVK